MKPRQPGEPALRYVCRVRVVDGHVQSAYYEVVDLITNLVHSVRFEVIAPSYSRAALLFEADLAEHSLWSSLYANARATYERALHLGWVPERLRHYFPIVMEGRFAGFVSR